MPVKLEHIQSPADADWNDLDKIHQETATNGLLSDRTALEHTCRVVAGLWPDVLTTVLSA